MTQKSRRAAGSEKQTALAGNCKETGYQHHNHIKRLEQDKLFNFFVDNGIIDYEK